MAKTHSTMAAADRALTEIESAILYAVLEKSGNEVIEELRRAHRHTQKVYNILDEAQLASRG